MPWSLFKFMSLDLCFISCSYQRDTPLSSLRGMSITIHFLLAAHSKLDSSDENKSLGRGLKEKTAVNHVITTLLKTKKYCSVFKMEFLVCSGPHGIFGDLSFTINSVDKLIYDTSGNTCQVMNYSESLFAAACCLPKETWLNIFWTFSPFRQSSCWINSEKLLFFLAGTLVNGLYCPSNNTVSPSEEWSLWRDHAFQ